jgi:hypothetical protein
MLKRPLVARERIVTRWAYLPGTTYVAVSEYIIISHICE